MSTITTLSNTSTAGWTDPSFGERALMPVAKLRAAGAVCPQHVIAVDEGGFTRTRAWSPPDC